MLSESDYDGMSDVQSYHVEWFVTGRSVQSDVTVRIGDGYILGVEAGQSADAIDLGPVALAEGLVNSHTHLEFSRLQEPIPTTGRFTNWIRAVIRYRKENPDTTSEAIAAGISESLQSGTTLLGDIATVGWSPGDYPQAQFKGVLFQEVLGLSSARIVQQMEIARTHACEDMRCYTPGISPHAPYSTHFDLVVEAVKIAKATSCPIAMHLAETKAELELLSNGTGEFRELLTDFGIWHDDLFRSPRKPMDYLEVLAQAPSSLIIHGNYLDEDELRFVAARPQMTLVYCPRTHAAFGHTEHPWRRLLELGGRVALGTDSRASNPDLSLFAELQFLTGRHPDISHVELLRIGSTEGRRALGFKASDPKSSANFTLIRSVHSPIQNPEQDLFALGNVVCGTMIDGRWVWLAS